MKIAVTSNGPTLDDKVDSRFGRCAYHLLVDTDDMNTEALKNPNITVNGCAGYPTGDWLADKGIQVVLTGTCGPHHQEQLRRHGVEVITGVVKVTGSKLLVREAVEQFKAGKFTAAP